MIDNNKINEILNDYKKVIDKFKLDANTQNGLNLAWTGNGYLDFKNKPTDYGTATTTTGWCVSVSEAFFNFPGFQMLNEFYGAYAKLISIDIKEQYYGYCYNGSQNKWHTAILIQIDEFKFVIDLTCGQFGNEFVNKPLWYLDAWLSKFRSPFCTHKIDDFSGNVYDTAPLKVAEPSFHQKMMNKYNLKNYTNIDESDRQTLMEFLNNFDNYNEKLLSGKFTKNDLQFLNKVLTLYQTKLSGSYQTSGYSLLRFKNKIAADNWLTLHLGTNKKIDYLDFELKQNLLLFPTENELHKHYDLPVENGEFTLIIKFANVFASKNVTKTQSYIIFAGTKLSMDKSNFVIDKGEDFAQIFFFGNNGKI